MHTFYMLANEISARFEDTVGFILATILRLIMIRIDKKRIERTRRALYNTYTHNCASRERHFCSKLFYNYCHRGQYKIAASC